MTNLRNTFYEDKQMQEIMKKYYQIKRNLITSLNYILILSGKNIFKSTNYARAKIMLH